MRKITCVIVLMLISYISKSDILDTTINLSGYYVIRYKKAEIINLYKQEVRKQRGESFTMLTDLETDTFFIPFEIGDKKLASLENFLSQIKNYSGFRQDTIFYIPTTNRVQENLNKLSKKHIDISEALCLFRDIRTSSPYFEITGSDKFLYKCVYFRGEAQVSPVENTSENRFKLDIDFDAVNMKSAKIWTIFITKVISYNPCTFNKGLTPWFPYISK
ncbi:hypothetical protein ACVWYN_001668 [Pedobacter sp. UYP24]